MNPYNKVLNTLRGSDGYTDRQLGLLLDMPAPSVRRVVHQLRQAGYAIDLSHGYYHYDESFMQYAARWFAAHRQ